MIRLELSRARIRSGAPTSEILVDGNCFDGPLSIGTRATRIHG